MRRYLIVAVVVLVVATAGCIGGDGGPSNETQGDNITDGEVNGTESDVADGNGTEPDGGEVANDTLAAIEDMEAYRYVLNQSVESQPLENGTNLSLAELRVQRHVGLVDLRDDELRMDVRTSTRAGSEQEGEFYVVDGVEYRGILTPNGTDWSVSNNTEGVQRTLSVNDRVGILRERLRNASVEYGGTEEVNGTETYRLEVDPSNPDAYINDVVEPTDEGPRVVGVNATDVTLQLWVSTETSLPVRMYETIDAQTVDRREVVDAPEAGFRFETRYDAYGYTEENVSVRVPEEAPDG
jgi:hypothetical protein